jgi:mannose-1-phosphate guanylyltransferase
MEKADNVYVMCTDIGWSDLGTWSSLYEHSHSTRGETLLSAEMFFRMTIKGIFSISNNLPSFSWIIFTVWSINDFSKSSLALEG